MNNEKGTTPPLPVWKLMLLVLATAGLYQFIWLHRTARDLATARDLPLTPLHWAAVPLLGPLAAIPGFRLASQIKQWQTDTDAEIGHLAEPVFIALFIGVAFLPLGLLAVDSGALLTYGMIASLATCIPYLALQGQINLNKRRDDSSVATARFVRGEVVAVAVGTVLALPLYALAFTDFWQLRGATTLAVGDVVARDGDFFRLRVNDAGWRRIEPGGLSDESALEFLGPDDDTWAIVYDSTGSDIDSVMAYRAEAVQEEFRGAGCKQLKSLLPDSLTVLGTIECAGRNAIYGDYIFVARVLGDRTRVAEIVGSTSNLDRVVFDERLPRLHTFLGGLELVP